VPCGRVPWETGRSGTAGRASADGDISILLDGATDKQNLSLLIQLRWVAVVGQVVTIAFVRKSLGIPLPLVQLAYVIAFLVCLNLFSLVVQLYRRESVSNTELFFAMLLDVAALTVQLYLTGGAVNPFISLYLLQVILGAVLLDAWSTWALVLITSVCFLALTRVYNDIFVQLDPAQFAWLRLEGTFISFALSASLLVIFVTRINRNLRARDARLASLRQQSIEEDHIVRLGLLASGAAHELGTPLATLSVILNDWQHMPEINASSEFSQELREMQSQLDRCKTIVSGILMSSGEARGEGTLRTTVNEFVDGLISEWRVSRSPTYFDYSNKFEPDIEIVSDTALKQVIFNLLDNAFEASPHLVAVRVVRKDDALVVTVSDRGKGFSPEMLAEFGKPYRSSKGRPGGGLGLFLVVNVVRKLGGVVTAENAEIGGAEVTLTLPVASLSPEEENDVG
jgi:two-component system sensor histidine kinase RegB